MSRKQVSKSKLRKKTRHTQSEIENLFDYGIDPRKRRIYLSSVSYDGDGREAGVDTLMAEFFIKGLWLMEGSSRKVTIAMNNIGGDWIHGMAIYDAIRAFPAPVDIEVYGHAMSMGAVILQAGRKRLLHPNSGLMIHDGYADSGDRPVQSARSWSNYEETLRKNMYGIFMQRAGHTPHYWKKRCSHDTIMTPKEAVGQGLADEVLHPKRELPVANSKTKRR